MKGSDFTIHRLRTIAVRLHATDRTNLEAFVSNSIEDALSYVEPSAEARIAAKKVQAACQSFVEAFDTRRVLALPRANAIEHRRARAQRLLGDLQRLLVDAPDSWIADLMIVKKQPKKASRPNERRGQPDIKCQQRG